MMVVQLVENLKRAYHKYMKEIEVKILEVDVAKLCEQLESMGAKRVFEGDLQVSFYDFEDKRLYEAGTRVRLRESSDQVEFTLKQKLSHERAKIADEFQVMVDDVAQLQSILQRLGMQSYRTYEKHRVSYTLGDARFEIDTYEGLPPLLEIEAPSVEACYELASTLGYSTNQIKPWSGSEVIAHYAQAASSQH